MSESAGKALDILFYLAKVEDEVSLARLSKETGMNKATALRYLAVMESRGVVEKRPSGWSLGLSLFELGSKVPVRTPGGGEGPSPDRAFGTGVGRVFELGLPGRRFGYLPGPRGGQQEPPYALGPRRPTTPALYRCG